MPLKELLDPQGKTTLRGLHNLGYNSISDVRIGNLKDISYRAIETLSTSDIIYCEDTRQTSKILNHYGISTKLIALNKVNEYKTIESVIQNIQEGKVVSLVSDAGTPLISDPGSILVKNLLSHQIEVDCLAGATAFVPALVNSGFDLSGFVFLGFPPHKKGRQTFIKSIDTEYKTIVLYESPHRIIKFLSEYKEFVNNDRKLSISREISKKFEETIRGYIDELIDYFNSKAPKGEFVI
ncbi:unnamed protein product, partial [Cyprideis torosa]